MPFLHAPVSPTTFILLMVAMELKHYAADFVLQTNWMARGKDRVVAWQMPLAAHVGLHGVGTLCIVLIVNPRLWWLMAVDVAIHGMIDRSKALVSQRTQFAVTDAHFWWLMGFDQLLHQFTNIGLVVFLATA